MNGVHQPVGARRLVGRGLRGRQRLGDQARLGARSTTQRRDHEEAQTLYELLQDHVIPLYYRRSEQGYSPEWVRMAKHSIIDLLPTLQRGADGRRVPRASSTCRPRSRAGATAENGYARAREVAEWKGRVRAAWPGVSLRRLDDAAACASSSATASRFEVAAYAERPRRGRRRRRAACSRAGSASRRTRRVRYDLDLRRHDDRGGRAPLRARAAAGALRHGSNIASAPIPATRRSPTRSRSG